MQGDSFSLVIVYPIILGLIGEGITRISNRMQAAQNRIRHIALVLGVGSGLCIFLGMNADSKTGSNDATFSNLIAAGFGGVFASFAWYFVVAVVAFCFFHIVGPPLRFLGLGRRWASQKSKERSVALQRWKQQRDYDQAAPLRAQEASGRASDQKRREDARADCEDLYSVHAPEIGERFTPAMFDQFVQRYMGDDRPADHVEQRAEQLRGIIEKHRDKADPPKKHFKAAEIARWYQEQRREIEGIGLDDQDKAILLAQLEEHSLRLQEKYLRELHP